MAWRDIRQGVPTEEPSGIRRSGQTCDQDVLLYRFSLVHLCCVHREGTDYIDGGILPWPPQIGPRGVNAF